jgi:hypothetical protein
MSMIEGMVMIAVYTDDSALWRRAIRMAQVRGVRKDKASRVFMCARPASPGETASLYLLAFA